MRYVSFETKDGLPKFWRHGGGDSHICDLSDGEWLDLSDVAEDHGVGLRPGRGPCRTSRDYAVCRGSACCPRSPGPVKVLCVGVNYPDRNSEYKDGSGAPTYMSLVPPLYFRVQRHRREPRPPPRNRAVGLRGRDRHRHR